MALSIKRRGFTLIELIIVMVILGVLALGVNSFIVFATNIFVDSTNIDRTLNSSRFVIDRMTQEIRNAIPSSVRYTSNSTNTIQCIEFVPIAASSSYVTMPFFPDTSITGTTYAPSRTIDTTNNPKLFIYPTTRADIYDPASSKGHTINAASVSGDELTVTFSGAVSFSESSPSSRFFISYGPVSYCFSEAGTINRYEDYGYKDTQPLPVNMGTPVLMAENLSNDFSTNPPLGVDFATLLNTSVVQLHPQFNVNDGEFQYQHQVQVINVP